MLKQYTLARLKGDRQKCHTPEKCVLRDSRLKHGPKVEKVNKWRNTCPFINISVSIFGVIRIMCWRLPSGLNRWGNQVPVYCLWFSREIDVGKGDPWPRKLKLRQSQIWGSEQSPRNFCSALHSYENGVWGESDSEPRKNGGWTPLWITTHNFYFNLSWH